MNNRTWNHHPLVMIRTFIVCFLLGILSTAGAIYFRNAILMIGTLIMILGVVIRYYWMRKITFTLNNNLRLSLSIPFELQRTTINIFNTTIEYEQGIIGKIFNAGDAIFHVENKTYPVRWIAEFREFKEALEGATMGGIFPTQPSTPVNVTFVLLNRWGEIEAYRQEQLTNRDIPIINSRFKEGDHAYRN